MQPKESSWQGISNRRTKHHNIPQCFDGGNDQSNCTKLPESEHSSFHEFAGHVPPDFYLRRAILKSINWHDESGHMIPVGYYRDLLQILLREDWREFYVPESFRNETPQNASTNIKYAKPPLNMYFAVAEEQMNVCEAIKAIGYSQYLTPDQRKFSHEAMLFFRAKDPISAMHSYVIDAENNERKWTKSFTKTTFKTLTYQTMPIDFEQMTRKSRESLLYTLVEHGQRLTEYSKNWKPAVNQKIDLIAKFGQGRHPRLMQDFFDREAEASKEKAS